MVNWRYLLREWHKEGDCEVALAEGPISMLHLGDDRCSHVDLHLGLVIAADIVEQTLETHTQHVKDGLREKHSSLANIYPTAVLGLVRPTLNPWTMEAEYR